MIQFSRMDPGPCSLIRTCLTKIHTVSFTCELRGFTVVDMCRILYA